MKNPLRKRILRDLIENNSNYVELDTGDGQIYVSSAYHDKYGVNIGDTITLKEPYTTKTYDLKTGSYIEVFVIGLAAYAAVALLEMRRIKKVPMDQALKNVE